MKNAIIINQTRPDQIRPDQNYGLSLLKLWMSFEVVLCHFWNAGKDFSPLLKPFEIARPMAVMTFMFTAFLLTAQPIISSDKTKIYRRINRLVIMQVGWAVIYFAFYALEALLFGKGMFAGRKFLGMVKELILQIFFGHTINQTMWFQVDLIVIYVMFAWIYFVMERRKALILTVFTWLAALAVQYSGINIMLFGNMGYTFKYSLGRICEMLPLACAGILFVNYDIMKKLSGHKFISAVLCAVLFIIAVKFREIIPNAQGFGYSGLYFNVAAVFLTAVFYLLPLNNIPSGIKNILVSTARFSPGVYCMHRLVAVFLKVFHIDNSFIFCIVIFSACLAVSFAISKISGKIGRYLVA